MQGVIFKSTSLVNGSLNLPIEMLEEILRWAVDDIHFHSALSYSTCISSKIKGDDEYFAPIMIAEDAQAFDEKWPEIFQTRLSIRLVCRLWNIVAQPFCDGFVSLNGTNSYVKIERFRAAMQENVGYNQSPHQSLAQSPPPNDASSSSSTSPSSTSSSVSDFSGARTRLTLVRGLSLTINPYDFIVPARYLLWNFIPSSSSLPSSSNSAPTSESEKAQVSDTNDDVISTLNERRRTDLGVGDAGEGSSINSEFNYQPKLKTLVITNWSKNQSISWSDILTDISRLEDLEVLAINGQTYVLPYDDTTLIDKQSLHHLHTLDISLQVRDQEFHWSSDRIPLFSAVQECMSFPNLKNLRIRDIHPRIVTSTTSQNGSTNIRNSLVKFLGSFRYSLVHLDLEVTGIVAMGSMLSQAAAAYEQFRWTTMYNYNSHSPYSTRIKPNSITTKQSHSSINMQSLTHLEVSFPYERFLISTLPIYSYTSSSSSPSPSFAFVTSSPSPSSSPFSMTPLETISINSLNRIFEWTDAGERAERRVWSFNTNRLDTMFDVIYRHLVYDAGVAAGASVDGGKRNSEGNRDENGAGHGNRADLRFDEDLQQIIADSRKPKPWSPLPKSKSASSPTSRLFASDSSQVYSLHSSRISLKTIILGDFHFHPLAWSRGEAFWHEFHGVISKWVDRFALSRYSDSYHDVAILARESRSHPAVPILPYLDRLFERTKSMYEHSRVTETQETE